MAAQEQLKIPFTEADRKVLNKYIDGLPKESREFKEEYCVERSYRLRGSYHNNRRELRGSIMSGKINHCKCGGGMSECSACELVKSGEKWESQKKCGFYKKASFADRCCYETFGEYCWSVDAQRDAQKG